MTHRWFQEYESDVPQNIPELEFSSLGEMSRICCQKYSDRPAFTCMGASITYGQLDTKANAFANYLTKQAGCKPGDRIALMMPNLLQYPIALFGALRAGLTVVNVNPLYTAAELRHQLIDSGAETILVVENFAHVLQEVIPDTKIKRVFYTALGDFLGFPKKHLVNFVVRKVKKMVPPYHIPGAINFADTICGDSTPATISSKLDDIAFLQYTGGTTGGAKGAILSHRNMLSNVSQAFHWLKGHAQSGQEAIITALPLYHIFSLTANCLVFMKIGAENILITNPRDLDGFVKTLKKTRFTAITGVNTLFNALANHPEISKISFANLRLTLGGGMAVQDAVATRWQEITGCAIAQAYGLTETSPAVSIIPLGCQKFNGTIGVPISSTTVSIRDDDDVELDIGVAGELCVKGPQVMQGYWQKPEESAATFSASGWLKTGDVATMDEKGYLKIVDRIKDTILVSGFNVYPNEIEEVVVHHPAIVEAAAIGVTCERGGEKVKLFVVSKDPNLTEKEVKEHCRKSLTGYKIPKIVEFRSELPKTNVGKILRRALREQ